MHIGNTNRSLLRQRPRPSFTFGVPVIFLPRENLMLIFIGPNLMPELKVAQSLQSQDFYLLLFNQHKAASH